jgi:hypothetical protein
MVTNGVNGTNGSRHHNEGTFLFTVSPAAAGIAYGPR